MSTYFYINSSDRDDQLEPTTDFIIPFSQSQNWSANPKNVGDGIISWDKAVVEISSFTIKTLLATPLPIILFNIVDTSKFDNSKVNTLNINDPEFRFILNYDAAIGYEWYNYKTEMKQVMDFGTQNTYTITARDENGVILTDVIEMRITLCVTPYTRHNFYRYIPIYP